MSSLVGFLGLALVWLTYRWMPDRPTGFCVRDLARLQDRRGR